MATKSNSGMIPLLFQGHPLQPHPAQTSAVEIDTLYVVAVEIGAAQVVMGIGYGQTDLHCGAQPGCQSDAVGGYTSAHQPGFMK